MGRLKLGEAPLKKIASNADLRVGGVARQSPPSLWTGYSSWFFDGPDGNAIVLFTGGSENT
jgi:hypothetical protein